MSYSHLKFSYENFSYSYSDLIYEKVDYTEIFDDLDGDRRGQIKKGAKDGLWIYQFGNIENKEYFKLGLRDRIFQIYDYSNNSIIYETVLILTRGKGAFSRKSARNIGKIERSKKKLKHFKTKISDQYDLEFSD